MLLTKPGLTLLLALVFAANYAETAAEMWVKNRYSVGSELSYSIANAIHWFENNFSFEYYDATNWTSTTNWIAVYGYSVSYFFLLPILGLAMAWAFARRADISAFRTFCLAVAIDYAVSLPFFLFFPVPERWAFPGAAATLLSDQWSTGLIEAMRPMSGLDHCFPSFHVSLTAILIATAYIFQLRLRLLVTAMGLTIILSTYILGIHWVADIIAGTAAGVFSTLLAMKLRTVNTVPDFIEP